MGDEKKVKDIMAHIDEYNTIYVEAPVCEVLSILKENYEKIKGNVTGKFHKTLIVIDASNNIVGKLSIFDLIRGLVPEATKKPELTRAYYRVLSSRAQEVADEIGAMQERFGWLHSSFFDLVKQECQKKVQDIMSPVHPLLVEEDNLNKAIYVMFKENIRQPVVTRKGKIVGVVNIMDIFPVLLEIAGG
jgi:CBS domain-containing protein